MPIPCTRPIDRLTRCVGRTTARAVQSTPAPRNLVVADRHVDRMPARVTMSKALVWAVLLGACAHGGSTEPTDAPVNSHHDDAPNNVTVDAPPDAFIPPDAAVPPDSAFICTANSQCTNAGECCFIVSSGTGFCTPGTILGGTCFPIQ